MALSDRNIVITPNRNRTDDPKIVFSGANAAVSAQNITLRVYPDNAGTLSFEGSAGQLFSITNSLSGTIFSVNDVSGMPSISVDSTGLILMAPFGGKVGIGTSSSFGMTSNIMSIYGTAMVYGNVKLSNPTGGTSGIYFNDGTYLPSATSYSSYGNPGTVQFAGSGNTFNGDSGTFVWDNSNKRLGIGVASPTNTLTVNGSTPAWFNTANGANVYELVIGNSATTTSTTIGYAAAVSVPYGYIAHTASASRNITFNSLGFTGIGGVTLPKNTLDVGGATVIGVTYAGNAVYTAPANGLAVQGSVGIGTTVPGTKLTVVGGIGATAVFSANQTATAGIDYNSGDNASRSIVWGPAGTTGIFSWWSGAGGAAATEKMRLSSNGDLMVGTTSAVSSSRFSVVDSVAKTVAAYVMGFGTATGGANDFQLLFYRSVSGAGAYHSIQSVEQGVAYRDLILQAAGGKVGIGTTSVAASTQLSVYGGNLQIGTASRGIVFPDNTFQSTAASFLTLVRQSYTATAGQTAFTVSGGYLVGALDVYQNGAKLNISTDYTATDGSTFNLVIGATVGDIIEAFGYFGNTVSIANAVPTTGGTMIGALNMSSGTRSVSSSTGAITVGNSGGIGVTGNVIVDDRVLIGSTTPGGKLVVSADRATTAFTQVWTGRNGVAFENDTVLGWNGIATFFGNYQNFPLTFITNTTERMRIAANGNVAIGTTDTTNAELTIQAVAGATTAGEIYSGDGTQWTRLGSNWGSGSYNGLVAANDHGIIFSNGSQNTGGFVIAQWSSASRGIRIAPTGNLLVGTSATVTGALMSVAGSITQDGDQVLDVGGGQLITGGYRITPFNLGNTSGATITPNPNNGNYQYASNNGAATINAPASDCAIDILIINTTGAAGFTFSGYTVVAGSTGDTAPTTSTTADWIISIRRINGISTYVIKVIAT